MKFVWLGLEPYLEGLALQRQNHEQVLAGAEDMILGVEHPTVITLGRRAQVHEEIFGPCSLEVVSTDRGGRATLHSPGQLVIYPHVDLKRAQVSIKEFVQTLLDTTAELLSGHGVKAWADLEQGGVYTKEGKIAFCGLRLDRGIVRHGLSLNVSNDLELFRQIRACGVTSAPLVSMEKLLKRSLSLELLFDEWSALFVSQMSHLHGVKGCESQSNHASVLS